MHPHPSCITFTGGGYHAYWWLDEPLSDMQLARQILRGLQQVSGGDALSVVNSLRLVGSRNSKPHRDNALCQIVEQQNRYYPVETFKHLLPRPTPKTSRPLPRSNIQSHKTTTSLNPDVLRSVTNHFIQMGYVQRGDWLSGACLYPERHQHDDRNSSFGFNARSGYGNCYVCGSILLKDICTILGIQPADYGKLYI